MKIFVDSRYRTPESASSSDFTIELTETLQLPSRCRVRIHDLSIPFSWYTVEPGLNQYIYYSEKAIDNSDTFQVLTLPAGQYSGPQLAVALALGLNAASIFRIQGSPDPYNVTYSDTRGTISIAVTTPGYSFVLYDDAHLRARTTWPFSAGTQLQPQSFNRNLRLTRTLQYTFSFSFISEFVNLRTIDCLYLTSNSLGNLSNIGPRPGQRNVLSMIAVTSGWGYLNHSEGESYEWTDASGQALKRLSFRLEDSTGAVVPLHGLDITFAVVLDLD